MAGYSGKPLVEKLGLKADKKSAAIDPPEHYAKLIGKITLPGAFGRGAYDFIHVFARDNAALKKQLPRALKQLAEGGRIWVSWPKKSAKTGTDITEDTIRDVVLPLGLVDVKVCSVTDELWSGLKIVVRRENRPRGSA